jgi:murein DD-endopeptidase MepM/ murein hydrolase activator NlpD
MKPSLSFIITRPNGRAFRFKLSVFLAKLIFGGSLFFAALLFISIIANVKLGIHYQQTKHVAQEQDEQTDVIHVLKQEVESLRQLMEALIKKEEAIRQDLGTPKYRRLSNRRMINRKVNHFVRNYPNDTQDVFIMHKISNELDYLKKNVLVVEKNMRRHVDVFDQYLAWYDETPSIWPIYGYVRSGYGWRTHPLKRSKQFHKGIDIPAWIGAPVQATADGFVEFSGWGGGYGWIVVLSHKFGYKTIYAHLSEIEVNTGRKVFKGQIIGKIGTSGLSTGPHVHYEIRQRRKALEPSMYLELDLFTAVSKLW